MEQTSTDKYLMIKDWNEHQSDRKDRASSPWIKIYRDLITNQKWSYLSDAEKGQLVSIWLIGARKNGLVIANSAILRKICSLDDQPDLNRFIELGFLVDNWLPDGCHLGRHREDKTRLDKTNKKDTKKVSSSLFVVFWGNYPKKVGKKNAETAFEKLSDEERTSVINCTSNPDFLKYMETKHTGAGDYRPHPSTWLNSGGWEDDMTIPEADQIPF